MSKQLGGTDMKRLHRSWRARTTGRLGLILDGLGSPFNVGSIVRSAAAYRVDHVWLAGTTMDLDHPGVAKTALGTDRYLRATRTSTGEVAVTEARTDGYAIIAVELTDDARALHQIMEEMPGAADVCLVVGHEDHGVAARTLAAVDHRAFLPMLGKVGSLNVATAAAIGLYEVRRRSWTAPTHSDR